MTLEQFERLSELISNCKYRLAQLEILKKKDYFAIDINNMRIDPGIFWDCFTPHSLRIDQLILNEKETLNNLLKRIE